MTKPKTFKVGDKVKIVRRFRNTSSLGKTGKIIFETCLPEYQVRFKHPEGAGWYLPDQLEKVQDKEPEFTEEECEDAIQGVRKRFLKYLKGEEKEMTKPKTTRKPFVVAYWQNPGNTETYRLVQTAENFTIEYLSYDLLGQPAWGKVCSQEGMSRMLVGELAANRHHRVKLPLDLRKPKS